MLWKVVEQFEIQDTFVEVKYTDNGNFLNHGNILSCVSDIVRNLIIRYLETIETFRKVEKKFAATVIVDRNSPPMKQMVLALNQYMEHKIRLHLEY